MATRGQGYLALYGYSENLKNLLLSRKLLSKILENPWSIVIFFVTQIGKYLNEWVGAIMVIHFYAPGITDSVGI